MVSSPAALAALVAGLTALGLWLEARYTWGARVGASLLVIVGGAVLSNLSLVPLHSPVYDAIGGPVTSLAIVWLLLAVDLRDLWAAGPRMLGGFALAAGATVIGVATGMALFGRAVGPETWKLSGVLTGTYTGGSVNFVAVGRALALPGTLFAAATASDNVMTAVWMGGTLMLPLWLARFWPAGEGDGDAAARRAAEHERAEAAKRLLAPVPLRVLDLAILVALGLALLWAADAVAAALPGLPGASVLALTTLALVAAQLPPVRRLHGALQLGTLALNLFFAIIGIASRISEIAKVGPEVFYLTATVVLVHGVVLYGGARLARLDLATASVASQAAIGGPSTAMALAVSRGWPRLALPGMLAGLMGYAAGTYLGLAVALVVRGWWAG